MIALATTGYDAGMDTLLGLAPVAALLAAFAYWIDRQNGKRIDDLAAANREAHALIGQRIDEQGRRIDDLRGDVGKLHALLLAIVPRAAADALERRPK